MRKWIFLLVAILVLQSLTVAGCGKKEITHTLTIAFAGNGSTSPAVGDHTFFDGAAVDITATSASGWQFDSWTGDVDTVDNVDAASTTIIMDGDFSITANFSQVAA